MKIDKRKKYFLVLDTETTNNDFNSSFNDGLVYDIGYIIIDKKGKIYAKKSFAVKEIFTDNSLMKTAYYINKLPLYYDKLQQKTMEIETIWNIRKELKNLMELFNIKEVYAYNASFDTTTLNNTVRLLSGSGCRWFFPYGTQVCDIWHIACQVLGTQKTFQWEQVKNAKGNFITNAERMYQYISSNEFFEEEHTGLADALIEGEILVQCLKSNKKIDKRINRSCWRIPNKIKVA